jgi:hypothetical protein
LALLAAAPSAPAAPASVILVTTTDQEVNSDADCSLQEAIFSANFDDNRLPEPANPEDPYFTTGCTAGNGADTILLPAGATFLVSSIVDDPASPAGMSVTPAINSAITILGNGARLERTGSLDLRAFMVSTPGAWCAQP